MKENKFQTPFYTGDESADMMRHDGGLKYVVGASNYQVLRANRKNPHFSGNFGYTYNHGPMLTYWKEKFYVQYLCNPKSEHTGQGMSLISTSQDGIQWERPKVSFPEIKIPAGSYKCHDGTVIEVPEETDGYMHQRVGFYQSADGKLFVSGFYGHSPEKSIRPWQNYGLGRVVREIFENGEMGPIYFIRYLDYSGWTEDKLPFPIYTKSPDKSFVAACEELLSNHLYTQQWSEEHGDADRYVTIKSENIRDDGKKSKTGSVVSSFVKKSSFCWYHIDESTVIGLWKHTEVGRSDDNGKTWTIKTEPSFVTSAAKAWGQKTEDGKYAMAYVNSLASEHRYPLVAAVSDDGIEYKDLAVVFGEVPPKRYDGALKDFGPQYVRGILEGNAKYPKGAMWLTHSVNKEDIYVTRVPVPLTRGVSGHISDDFSDCEDGYIKNWNIYSPIWAPIRHMKMHDGKDCLKIADKDPCDYAKAMRIFPKSEKIGISFDFMVGGNYEKDLEIELADEKGTPALRLLIGKGSLWIHKGYGKETIFKLSPQIRWYSLKILADCMENAFSVSLDNSESASAIYKMKQKVYSLERLVLRTKAFRYLPNIETHPNTPDMQDVEEPIEERVYYIRNVKSFGI